MLLKGSEEVALKLKFVPWFLPSPTPEDRGNAEILIGVFLHREL